MKFSSKSFLILSALALLFLSSNAISPSPEPSPAPGDSDGIIVVDDPENNATVRALGVYAIEKANEQHLEKYPMKFGKVFDAKYVSSNERTRFFFNINVTESQDNYKEVEGNFYGYVFITPYSIKLLSWVFIAA